MQINSRLFVHKLYFITLLVCPFTSYQNTYISNNITFSFFLYSTKYSNFTCFWSILCLKNCHKLYIYIYINNVYICTHIYIVRITYFSMIFSSEVWEDEIQRSSRL